jgi:hypothetical protein
MWQIKLFFGDQFENVENEINRFIQTNHIDEFTLNSSMNDYGVMITMKYKMPVVETHTGSGSVYCIM